MGVTGLWNLIEDSGNKVDLKTLHGKVLAIDLSIWINQSIKGFRDKNGRQVENAHILGLFHRVCKLLFYNIKPIFVFDGQSPILKSRTRSKRDEKNRKTLAKSKNMSLNVLEKYIHSQLGGDVNSQALLVATKNKLKLANRSLLSELFLPPNSESRQVDIYQEFVELNKQISNRVDDSDSEQELENDNETNVQRIGQEDQDEVVSYNVPDVQNIRDIDINSEHFKSLPAATRYEILVEMRESYKGRKNPFPEMLPTDSDVFSQYQMTKLLKKRNLQEEIEKLIDELNGANNEDNIELLKKSNSSKLNSELLLDASNQLISGGRLASDEHTRFLLLKKSISRIKNPSDNTENEKNEMSEKQIEEQQLVSQNFAYNLPNCVTDNNRQFSSDLSRIEHLSQATTSVGSQSNVFQSKLLAGHLDRNVKKLTNQINTSNLDLSDSDSISSDSDDFVEVEPLELESSQDNSTEESNAFLDSIVLPYNTDYSINVSVVDPKEDENQIDGEVCNSKQALTTSIILSHDNISQTELTAIKPANERSSQQVVNRELSTKQLINLENTIDQSMVDKESEHFPVKIVNAKEPTTPPLPPPPSSSSLSSSVVETGIVTENSSTVKPAPRIVESINVEELVQQVQESNKISRQAASVTKQMVDECQELLRLFGVPWVVAPAEAEAQCAALEQLGLCEGVITDDSDIFLFGGKRVLRNFFTNSKFITQYRMEDLEKYFGLNREKLICLGMLCGTDYTLGIDGIGPVTALEVLSEFPGDNMEPLVKFADWYRNKVYSPGKNAKPENATRAKLLKFVLPTTFPSRVIFDAYFDANTDNSRETFSWASPQLSELRKYAHLKFGWPEPKTDSILLPVLKNLNEKQVQSRIEFFFPQLSKNSAVAEKLKIKRSKRLNEAIRRNVQQSRMIQDQHNKSHVATGAPKRKKSRLAKSSNKLSKASTSKQNSDTLVLSEESSSDSS